MTRSGTGYQRSSFNKEFLKPSCLTCMTRLQFCRWKELSVGCHDCDQQKHVFVMLVLLHLLTQAPGTAKSRSSPTKAQLAPLNASSFQRAKPSQPGVVNSAPATPPKTNSSMDDLLGLGKPKTPSQKYDPLSGNICKGWGVTNSNKKVIVTLLV